MNFYIMTLFPELVMGGLMGSIMKRGMDKGRIDIEAVNIRDYTTCKHGKVDDYPFGGGAGMLLQAQPVYDCYKAILKKIPDHDKKPPKVLYMSPQGKTFHQQMARELSEEEDLILLCGHYEGIDQRVLDKIGVTEVSIGDYVLTGGELAAMVMVDTIARRVPGVLNNDSSTEEESFSNGLLEYPQYTRPEIWEGEAVPEVLLSGHHKKIETYRINAALENTKNKRPDLYEAYLRAERVKKI